MCFLLQKSSGFQLLLLRHSTFHKMVPFLGHPVWQCAITARLTSRVPRCDASVHCYQVEQLPAEGASRASARWPHDHIQARYISTCHNRTMGFYGLKGGSIYFQFINPRFHSGCIRFIIFSVTCIFLLSSDVQSPMHVIKLIQDIYVHHRENCTLSVYNPARIC